MATFIERVMAYGDLGEETPIDPAALQHALYLYATGDVDAAYIKQLFALTTPQGDELDEVLATKPATLLSLVNAVSQAQWPGWVTAILSFGRLAVAEFDTPTKCRTAMGL